MELADKHIIGGKTLECKPALLKEEIKKVLNRMIF